jgi:hypothetical protein
MEVWGCYSPHKAPLVPGNAGPRPTHRLVARRSRPAPLRVPKERQAEPTADWLRAPWHIDVAGVAGGERPCLDELERQRLGQVAEDRHSRAQCGGLDVQSVLVDQATANECARKPGATVGNDVAARLRLDALDFLYEVRRADGQARECPVMR